MSCLNYKNLAIPTENDDMLFSEYWYEFLPEVLLSYTSELDIEVPNEVLMKNYDFYKLCHEFNGSLDSLTFYLNDEGYRCISAVRDKDFMQYLKHNISAITTGTYNFYREGGIFILAIKCNPDKIVEIREEFKLRMDNIGLC